MRFDRREFLTAAGAVLAAPPILSGAGERPAKGLVIGQPEGAQAGIAVLAAGGNAVDAVVTAALLAGVVALPSTGIGGYGGHLVVARPMARAEAFGDDDVERLADRLARREAKDALRPGVPHADHAVAVAGNDRVGRPRKDRPRGGIRELCRLVQCDLLQESGAGSGNRTRAFSMGS